MVNILTETERRLKEQVERLLGPKILGYLHDPDVEEIMLNPDSSLWIDGPVNGMERVGEFPAHQADSLISAVASSLKTVCNASSPILECELPYDGSRFEGLIPPVVRRPTFSIRKAAEKIYPLSDYVAKGIITEEQRQIISDLIVNKANILVAGGTKSGKTTFTNAIIDEIARRCPNDRLLIIQDTNELQSSAKNVVFLRACDAASPTALLRATLRLRPDSIIVGEVRDGAAAMALLKAWNTGHEGGAATIHCNGDEQSSFLRLEELCGEVVAAPKNKLIAETVGVVVFIKHDSSVPAGRVVKSIFTVNGFNGETYNVNRC